MAKYVAGHSGRLETDKDAENYGKPRAGEVIRIGNAHFNEGEEIPERVIAKMDPKALEADLKRGIIKRLLVNTLGANVFVEKRSNAIRNTSF